MMKPISISYKPTHIRALDGFRGMAIVMVLLFHLFPFFKLFSFGWMGVDLFFVLSGLLITGILIDSKDEPNYYTRYIAKRVLRIFPLYYAFLVLFFVVFPLVGLAEQIPNFSYLTEHQPWYWAYLQNWLVLFDPDFPPANFLSHFWSLAIEEQFYVFWPLVVYVTPRNKMLYVALAFIIVSLLLRITLIAFDVSTVKAYVFTFSRLDGLCIGASIATMLRIPHLQEKLNHLTKPVMIVTAILTVAVIGVGRSVSFAHPAFATIGYTVIDLFFGACMVFALSTQPGNLIKGVAENFILVFFGKYSYGMYVYHIPVYFLVQTFLKGVTEKPLIISLLALVATILVAMISFHGFEKHFLKLKSMVGGHHSPAGKVL
ncbi:MAG TPA: acyltransferase [Cyclobacteriaceae bacterium]|nr:acyltransferase [Cyclobacteriaceae bacterium]